MSSYLNKNFWNAGREGNWNTEICIYTSSELKDELFLYKMLTSEY